MSDLKERVARALARQAYSAGGMERIIDPYTPDAEYWQGQADAAIDLVLEEAARCAEGYERVIQVDPPIRAIIGEKEYVFSGTKTVDTSGRDDIAAAIRALAQK